MPNVPLPFAIIDASLYQFVLYGVLNFRELWEALAVSRRFVKLSFPIRQFGWGTSGPPAVIGQATACQGSSHARRASEGHSSS